MALRKFVVSHSLCWIFFVVFVMPSSSRKAPIQLAFGIMTYERKNQAVGKTIEDFHRLMSEIYEDDQNHVYVLHTDIKSSPLLHEHIHQYCFSKKNCISIVPRSVTWGGVSVTEMNLALMQAADDFIVAGGNDALWEYFILLGHESLPLTTLRYTEQLLLSYPSGTNFINCWKSTGYDFFGQLESLEYRLANVVIDSTKENVLHETSIWRGVPEGLEIYKSLQYVVLSREFVKYSCHGPETRRVLLFLANVKASDELLFPTLLQINKTLAATATCDTTLHFTHWIRPGGSWHPEYLSIEHLPLLLNTSSHLFMRKIQQPFSDNLIKVLKVIRANHYDTFSLWNSTLQSGESSDAVPSEFPGVKPLYKQIPLLQQREIIDREMRWLIPIGVDHLQALWEDDNTDSRILDAVMDYALQSLNHSQGHDAESNGHFYSSPFELLMTLDVARRMRDSIEIEKYLRYINS